MTDFSTTSGVVIFRVKVSCMTSVDGIIYSVEVALYSGQHSPPFEQLRPVWAALKYKRDQKRIKEITNLRMKYYMINSIVQTILLTAFLIKFAFNTKTCKLINFLLHSIKFLNLQEINHACHASLSKSWKNRERESTKRMFEIILLWLARSPYVSMKHRHVHMLYQLTAGTAHHNFELRIYAQLSPKPLGPACQLSVRLREMSILQLESQIKGQ